VRTQDRQVAEITQGFEGFAAFFLSLPHSIVVLTGPAN
jgi:hypothetical protein